MENPMLPTTGGFKDIENSKMARKSGNPNEEEQITGCFTIYL
jgi:hypothetical protein